jgi:putative acetyltransferase
LSITIGEASLPELDALVAVLHAARRDRMPYLPTLHTSEEDRQYFGRLMMSARTVAVWENGLLVGFCISRPGWIDHLYVLPDYQRRGIGRRLLDQAKSINDGLQLWVFQRNCAACRFYEQNGFKRAEETSGEANEEHEPDARYVWRAVQSGCERFP